MELDRRRDLSRSVRPYDFAFAFDNPYVADRILKLLIFDDSLEEKSENTRTDGCELKDLIRSLKRREEEIPAESPKKFWVKSINICSVILAERSPYFRKLCIEAGNQNEVNLSNERLKNEITLRIHSSEEDSLMAVLKFIYNIDLASSKTPDAVLGVLFAAVKYDVPSCVSHCCKLLLSFPLTVELALLYTDDLPSMLSFDATELQRAAEHFLANNAKDYCRGVYRYALS